MQQTQSLQTLNRLFNLDTINSRIFVVGLGVTGFSVVAYLSALGFKLAVLDSRENPPFKAQLLAEYPAVTLLTGDACWSVPMSLSHYIVSPGLAMDAEIVRPLLASGATALSELDLFACATEQPIVAITGSNGKSTVTTLLADMAVEAGKKVAVGGNLGTAMLDLLADEIELYVLELSSFQLERACKFSPDLAVVLNVSEDHLDRYSDFDAYAKAKQRIYQGQGFMLLNADDACVMAMADDRKHKASFGLQVEADYTVMINAEQRYLVCRGERLFASDDLNIQGEHNEANALAAFALGDALNLPRRAMCQALSGYKGLAHRMQCVAEYQGVRWLNDSKATNVGACIAALRGFDAQQVILIAGGDAKGAEMHALSAVMPKVKQLILIGKDAALFEQALAGRVTIIQAAYLQQAVKLAAQNAVAGNVVLLSPACASLDQFDNYQQRGEQFSKYVLEMVCL